MPGLAGIALLRGAERGVLIPVVESRAQLARLLETRRVPALVLRHCNLFELAAPLASLRQRGTFIYVQAEQLEGINPDQAGLSYLAEKLHVTGIISHNPRVLLWGKEAGLETIQRVYVLDSTGLESALMTLDLASVDMLDFAPALVLPHVLPRLEPLLSLPYMASGLLESAEQVATLRRIGVYAIAATRPDLWALAGA